MSILEEALAHHRAGQLQQAEAIYRQILRSQPDHPGVLHLLGLAALQMGQTERAVRLIEQVIKVEPDIPAYHNSLGEGLAALQDLDGAIASYRQALALEPDCAEAYNNLGNALAAQGKFDEAVVAYGRASALKPSMVEVHNNLGNALAAQRKLREAISAYEHALVLKPDYSEAYYNLGNARREQGEFDEASAAYQKALAIRPNYAEAHTNLGLVFMAQSKPAEAIAAYRQALALQPNLANTHNNLGGALWVRGKSDEAIAAFRHVITLNPDDAEAHNTLGVALREQGDLAEAIVCFERALVLKPDNAEIYNNLANSRKYNSADHEDVTRILGLLGRPKLTEQEVMFLHFALGKIYDDCGLYDDAFAHYQDANRRNTSRFDAQAFSDSVSRTIHTFGPELLSHHARGGSSSELPVFIVGTSRSGKTLAERLMSGHPHVHGAGELDYFYRLRIELSERLKTSQAYPECIPLIDVPTTHSLAESYIDLLRQRSTEARRVVNTILNFTYIGLITLLFPKGRIIHIRRHPLDVCLEIYFKYFAEEHFYSYDLEDIVVYYHEYQRLMAHWYHVLPDRMLTVDYENMVHNKADTLRKLFHWCDLGWDENDPSYANDAGGGSTWKGQEQLSQQYIGRWENYDKFIGPLKRGLGYS